MGVPWVQGDCINGCEERPSGMQRSLWSLKRCELGGAHRPMLRPASGCHQPRISPDDSRATTKRMLAMIILAYLRDSLLLQG